MKIKEENLSKRRKEILFFSYIILAFFIGFLLGFLFLKINVEPILEASIPCIDFCVNSPGFNESLKSQLSGTNYDPSQFNQSFKKPDIIT